MKYSYNVEDEIDKIKSDIRLMIAALIIFLFIATFIFCAIDDAADTQDNQTPIEQTEIVDTVDEPAFQIVYDNAEKGYQLVKIIESNQTKLYIAEVMIDTNGHLQYISFTPID